MKQPVKVVRLNSAVEKLKYLSEVVGRNQDGDFYASEEAVMLASGILNDADNEIATLPTKNDVSVWYGSMPESNGKSNWTATLHMVGGCHHMEGFCFARSEYPDRVRYEADRVRWVIGELSDKPCILDYDADLHSGYVPKRYIDDETNLRKRIIQAIFDPGASEGFKGDRTLTDWQADAVMKVIKDHLGESI